MSSKNKQFDEDDDMPELEDLSEELGKIRQKLKNDDDSSEIKLNVINNNKPSSISQNVQIPIKSVETTTITPNNTSNTNLSLSNQSQKPSEELSGFRFKKGFFLRDQEKESNNNNSTVSSNKAKESDNKKNNDSDKIIDLTHVKSSGETIKDKFISQIKSDVKENSTDVNKSLNYINEKKDEWCNANLLNAIAQKPSLMKYFMDPRFADAIQLMQKDPEKFVQIYGKNPEFNDFIKEFSSIMATHFNKIGDDKQAMQPPMDKEVEKIISEPKVKAVIEKLQREGKLDVYEIQRDPELSMKIKILIDKGFLKLQRE